MNRTPQRILSRPAHRLLFAALLWLPVSGACSSSSSDDSGTPITYDVEVATLDGNAPTDNVALRCDHDSGKAVSTLAVSVTITSIPANEFVLRPANACGSATRCGYVRVQALTSDDQVLATTETATSSGVLVLDVARLSELSKIQVSLIKGLDQKPLLNPDLSEVTATVSPTFTAPSDCVDELSAAGGAGGAAGAANGGAGGQTPDAGAGGMLPTPGSGGAGAGGEAGAPVGGVGGDGTSPVGGAGAAGAAALAGAGMGGA